MKLYNGFAIIAGLAIFLGLMFAPFVMGKAVTKEYTGPKDLAKPKGENCIESVEFMREKHMVLLDQWRDWALRDGKRVYINHEGKEFRISLQNTCMECHTSMKDFCGRCHADAGVDPYCWDCHIAPEDIQ